jgi:hypothetical protein
MSPYDLTKGRINFRHPTAPVGGRHRSTSSAAKQPRLSRGHSAHLWVAQPSSALLPAISPARMQNIAPHCQKAGQPSAGIANPSATFSSNTQAHVTTGFTYKIGIFPFFNWKDCMTPA